MALLKFYKVNTTQNKLIYFGTFKVMLLIKLISLNIIFHIISNYCIVCIMIAITNLFVGPRTFS